MASYFYVDPAHDRRLIEEATSDDTGYGLGDLVVVTCPHHIGLAIDGPGDFLSRLPCPCNDPSQVVAAVTPKAQPPLSIPPTPIVPLKEK